MMRADINGFYKYLVYFILFYHNMAILARKEKTAVFKQRNEMQDLTYRIMNKILPPKITTALLFK